VCLIKSMFRTKNKKISLKEHKLRILRKRGLSFAPGRALITPIQEYILEIRGWSSFPEHYQPCMSTETDTLTKAEQSIKDYYKAESSLTDKEKIRFWKWVADYYRTRLQTK